MNLSGGGGLAAINAYDQAMNDVEKRQRFEWERQRAEAELSNLDAKARAERSGYDLSAGQNRAGLELLPSWKNAQESNYNETTGANQEEAVARPGRVSNTLKQQGMESYGLDRASARQPTEEDVKDTNARAQTLTSQSTLDNLPDQLQTAAMKGLIDKQGVHEVMQGIVADFIGKNDKQGAINFMNKSAEKGGVGRKVVDIQQTQTGYKFIDADGGAHEMPVADIYRARQMYLQKLNAGKYKFLAAKDGSVVAGNENTGRADVVYQGNPNTMNQEHQPAEVKTAEWLIKNGAAKDANQAWAMVRSAKEKTRSEFVMDIVSRNAMYGQDAKMAQQAGAIYDTIKESEGSAPTQNTQKSNNPQGDTLLKKLNIGVP